jgi:hypothetical protein
METPVNILVESPDPVKANLVGKAIAQGLRDGYGFNTVMHAHVLVDTPESRSWTVSTAEEQEESILQAMVNLNPNIMDTPVTIVSRGNDGTDEPDIAKVDQLLGKRGILLQGIGEEGMGLEELQEQAWRAAQPTIRPMVEKFAQDIIEMFDTSSPSVAGVK